MTRSIYSFLMVLEGPPVVPSSGYDASSTKQELLVSIEPTPGLQQQRQDHPLYHHPGTDSMAMLT